LYRFDDTTEKSAGKEISSKKRPHCKTFLFPFGLKFDWIRDAANQIFNFSKHFACR